MFVEGVFFFFFFFFVKIEAYCSIHSMHDPVITKTGHSYERATLLEHLKRSPTDPLTREPLTVNDLRPNIALRHVLEEFWKTAGSWAVEW